MVRSIMTRLGLLLPALALLLISAGGALAQSADPAGAQVLADGATRTGVLSGSRGGAYAYYAVHYPGNDASVTIDVRFSPADPAILQGVGMEVYGDQGRKLGQGARNEQGYRFTRTEASPATWLVQLYNYLPGTAISYHITATGLGSDAPHAGAATGRAGSGEAQPGAPPRALPQTGSGPSIYETVVQDGRFTQLSIALILADMADGLRGAGDYTLFAPIDAAFARLPRGSWEAVQRDRPGLQRVLSYHLVPRRLTRAEIARGGTVTTASGDSLSLRSVRIAGGPISAGNGVIYAVSAVLMPGPRGTPLTSGALVGSAGGAYAMAPLPYPASGAAMTVRMQFGPDNPGISKGVGFTVYGPTGDSWQGGATGKPGEREITILSMVPGEYQVQVYNYIEGLVLNYVLSME